MQQDLSTLSFFVKIEGQSYSNHRNPQGVYEIEVKKEKSLSHSACAALQVARDYVPFLGENPDCFTLKAYSSDGQEIIIPQLLMTRHEDVGIFKGRAFKIPESITLQ